MSGGEDRRTSRLDERVLIIACSRANCGYAPLAQRIARTAFSQTGLHLFRTMRIEVTGATETSGPKVVLTRALMHGREEMVYPPGTCFLYGERRGSEKENGDSCPSMLSTHSFLL